MSHVYQMYESTFQSNQSILMFDEIVIVFYIVELHKKKLFYVLAIVIRIHGAVDGISKLKIGFYE